MRLTLLMLLAMAAHLTDAFLNLLIFPTQVSLTLGRCIKVRKMACHNGLAFLHRPSKPPRPASTTAAPAAAAADTPAGPAPEALLSSAKAAAAAAAAGTLEPKSEKDKKEKKPTRRGPRKHPKMHSNKPDAAGKVAAVGGTEGAVAAGPPKVKKPYRGNKRAADKKAGQNASNKRPKPTPAVVAV